MSLKTGTRTERQIGPWFYAPLLTSVVTPPFLSFLVGPSRPNRRKDGKFGGNYVKLMYQYAFYYFLYGIDCSHSVVISYT